MLNLNPADIMKGAKTAGNAIHLLKNLYDERHTLLDEAKNVFKGKNPETITRRLGDVANLIGDVSQHFHRR
jgi:hypothetical protein